VTTTPEEPTSQPGAAAPPRAVFATTPSTILAGTTTTPERPPSPREPADQRDRPAGTTAEVGPPRGPAAVVAVVTLAVAVAVVLAVVVTGLSNRSGGQASSATTATVEKAATTGTQAALSYNYQHLASDFAAAEKFMTPSFTANFKRTTGTSVQPLAAKYHAASTATVVGAGVGSLSSSHATVLVFVDQTVTNTQLSGPRLDRSRVEVSLVNSGGRWLIDNLSPI
jgi:Mce-associated membrane protein